MSITLQDVYDCASPDQRKLPLWLEVAPNTFNLLRPALSQYTTITEDEDGKHGAQMLVLSSKEA